MRYRDSFISHLDLVGVKYEILDEYTIKIAYDCENKEGGVTVFVFFDEAGDNQVHFVSSVICTTNGKRELEMLRVVNTLNREWRWITFVMGGRNGEIYGQADTMVDLVSVGAECLERVQRMVRIISETYPLLMNALWK